MTWRVAATPAGVVLEVSDQGPGVATHDLGRLTERFFRGDTAGAQGSGLGLAIVQRIAQLHEARLTFGNRPEGGLLVALIFPAL